MNKRSQTAVCNWSKVLHKDWCNWNQVHLFSWCTQFFVNTFGALHVRCTNTQYLIYYKNNFWGIFLWKQVDPCSFAFLKYCVSYYKCIQENVFIIKCLPCFECWHTLKSPLPEIHWYQYFSLPETATKHSMLWCYV